MKMQFAVILDGFSKSKSELPFVVIGDVENGYGQYLTNKFKHHNVVFLGPLFDKTLLNNLRFYTQLYFHGHMVGGTNPSLLEAMASSALICVHGNLFNRSTIDEETTLLFKTREDIKTIIDTIEKNNGWLKKGLHHSDELAKPVESTNRPSTPNEDETFSDYNKKKQHLNKLKLVINGSEHPSIQKTLISSNQDSCGKISSMTMRMFFNN